MKAKPVISKPFLLSSDYKNALYLRQAFSQLTYIMLTSKSTLIIRRKSFSQNTDLTKKYIRDMLRNLKTNNSSKNDRKNSIYAVCCFKLLLKFNVSVLC